ncbi:exopolysaccharide biosynthesis polyprenyl glycosylphosphotransferase [Streptomyces similanensis]|uniref:Exopolysaccharide biosynthesis polyprenyl glycosylphosphotransferase n=1 Tax=Streptomyces similanensis TaxID=1274988 RepID=A0ABP9KZW2_9ACTN
MTAERTDTVPLPASPASTASPAAPPRDGQFTPVSVVPPRGAATAFRFPAVHRPVVPGVRTALLVADCVAALLGALALSEGRRHPLLVALLVAVSLLVRPRGGRRPAPGLLDELPAVWGRTAVAWLALAALAAAYGPGHVLPTRTVLTGLVVQAVACCALRGAVHGRRRAALLRHPHPALVVGPVATAQRVAAAVLRSPRSGVRPVGIVGQPDGVEGLPVLTTGEEVKRAVIQNGVRAVLVVGGAARAEQESLLRALAESGCRVWELDAGGPGCPADERLAGFPCRRLDLAPARREDLGKRALDVLVSGALLALVSPLLLVCATVLRLSDGPGVVFRQERIGRDGRPFTLLKFRTHRPVDERESATRWSVANEHEMRRFCRMLRRTSLDELLQLWNVLRGDMSLVGPRPERPYFVAQFSQTYPGYAARHRVRAGLTGLAQVHGLRGDTSIEDRSRFDNAYIDDWSLWQDVCILLRTAVALVRPTGS